MVPDGLGVSALHPFAAPGGVPQGWGVKFGMGGSVSACSKRFSAGSRGEFV